MTTSSASVSISSRIQSTYLIIVAILSTLGIAVSSYATWHHLSYLSHGATKALCNINDRWSCDDIAASPYSEFLGFPLGVWGIAYFLIILGIAIILMPRRALTQQIHSHLAALVYLSFFGLATSLVLGGISFFIIDALCITCVMVYILTIALAAVSLYFILKTSFPLRITGKYAPWSGIISAMILMLITLAGYSQVIAPKKDPTQFSDHPIQNEKRRQQQSQNAAKTFADVHLASTVEDIPLSRSPYTGLGEDYRLGGDDAQVTVVEFADFQCSACKAMSSILHALHQNYKDRVNFVFKNYPLSTKCNSSMKYDIHPKACDIAVLSRCAGMVGTFWKFHDLAFAKQKEIKDKTDPASIAEQSSLTPKQITQCRSNADFLAKVKDDIALGNRLNIQGTPTLFINGRRYTGDNTIASIAKAIDFLLNNSNNTSSEGL